MPAPRPNLTHPLSWRSRHFRGFLLLVVLILAIRLTWGWHTHRTLQAQLDDLRRRGEPTTLADLQSDPLPDAENAWALQIQAARIAQGTGVWSPSSSNDEYRDFPPFPNNWMKRATASEAAHGQVFALARQARQLPRAQLHANWPRPAVNALLMPPSTPVATSPTPSRTARSTPTSRATTSRPPSACATSCPSRARSSPTPLWSRSSSASASPPPPPTPPRSWPRGFSSKSPARARPSAN